MRYYDFQIREIFENLAGDELHERYGVAVDIVGTGAMELRVARHADVNHRWDF